MGAQNSLYRYVELPTSIWLPSGRLTSRFLEPDTGAPASQGLFVSSWPGLSYPVTIRLSVDPFFGFDAAGRPRQPITRLKGLIARFGEGTICVPRCREPSIFPKATLPSFRLLRAEHELMKLRRRVGRKVGQELDDHLFPERLRQGSCNAQPACLGDGGAHLDVALVGAAH